MAMVDQQQSTMAEKLKNCALLHQDNDFTGAETAYKELLSGAPNDPQVLNLLGLLYLDIKSYDESVKYYHRALEQMPNNADTYYNLGLAYFNLQQWNKALACNENALQLDPSQANAVLMKVRVLFEKREHNAAIALLKAQPLANSNIDILQELTRNYLLQKDWDNAVNSALDALKLNPHCEKTLHKLASAIIGKNSDFETVNQTDMDQVLQLTQTMLACNPQSWRAHLTNGIVQSMLGQDQLAVDCFQRALSYEPDCAEIQTSLGITLLRNGDLKQGWSRLSERHRFGEKMLGMDRHNLTRCDKPFWQGEIYPGMCLFIASEQGIGDQILQAQLIQELIDQKVQIIFSCASKIMPLMQRSLPAATIIAMEGAMEDAMDEQVDTEKLKSVDFKATLYCLGRYLRDDFSKFPTYCPNPDPTKEAPALRKAFLQPDPILLNDFKNKYTKYGKRLKIGIAWRSSSPTSGQSKSTELIQWLPILNIPEVEFFNIQYGDISADIDQLAKCGLHLHCDEQVDHFNDIEAATAQIAAMDMIISTSNASAHMAASLNIPTWIMLHDRALWHWFNQGQQSPWYQTARLYRQTPLGSWQPVIQAVADDLRTIVDVIISADS